MSENRQPDLFQGLTQKEREDNLEALAHSIDEDRYRRPLSEQELADRKDTHIAQCVEINQLTQRKSDFVAEIGAKLKPLAKRNAKILDDIAFESVEETGKVYAILSDDNARVDIYNAAGQWIRSRKPLPEERQRHIAMRVAG